MICKPKSSKFKNKGLKCFTLVLMNLYNIWVLLSEMSDKNILINIKTFVYVPVYVGHLCVI